jgi:hypothetical protein
MPSVATNSLLLVVHPDRWAMHSECIEEHEWETYVALETFLSDGTRDRLRDASPRVTERW